MGLVELVTISTWILTNWSDIMASVEQYLPLAGEIVEYEFKSEMQDSISSGDMTYQELTQTLETKLGAFVTIVWPQGVSYEQDDVIEVIPDHVYVTWPNTEIVLCDICNMYTFLSSIPWSTMHLKLRLLGTIVTTNYMSNFYSLPEQSVVPWTRKLWYKDTVSGVVDKGENFDPVKQLTWGQVKPMIVDGVVIGTIAWLFAKFGLASKTWKVLKAGKEWRSKRIMRSTLAKVLENTTTIGSAITTAISVINANVSVENNQNETKIDELKTQIGFRFK